MMQPGAPVLPFQRPHGAGLRTFGMLLAISSNFVIMSANGGGGIIFFVFSLKLWRLFAISTSFLNSCNAVAHSAFAMLVCFCSMLPTTGKVSPPCRSMKVIL
jgi:hypothetical protein